LFDYVDLSDSYDQDLTDNIDLSENYIYRLSSDYIHLSDNDIDLSGDYVELRDNSIELLDDLIGRLVMADLEGGEGARTPVPSFSSEMYHLLLVKP
jgi:hypothetical protein